MNARAQLSCAPRAHSVTRRCINDNNDDDSPRSRLLFILRREVHDAIESGPQKSLALLRLPQQDAQRWPRSTYVTS